MSSNGVPTNLIPTRITSLPEDPAPSSAGYLVYVRDGVNYKVQASAILDVSGVPLTRQVIAGTGLTGGGQLANNVTLSVAPGGIGPTQLASTGVAAGTYGDASTAVSVTVDAQGRITSISTSAIVVSGYVPTSTQVIAGTGLTGGGALSGNVTLSASLSDSAPLSGDTTGSSGVSTSISRADHQHPAVDLSDDDQVDNILGLSNGGTARSLVMDPGAIIWSGADGLYVGPAGSPGQVLVSGGSGEYTWGTAAVVSEQTANTFFAGPSAGPDADASFRSMVNADLPDSGVVGGSYGSSGLIPVVTVNSKGVVTGITTQSVIAPEATNVAGGAANQIVYNTGAGATSFIAAPTVANTYLNWSGSAFQWSANPLGTVTSVDVSGGTTGLTTSGGPVTDSGTITLAGTLSVANGGTGQTSYTDGQLLIGNSSGNTLTKATLTAGSGVSITNGNGSISISATGTGGTVTSVSGTGTVNGITLTGTVTTSGSLTLGGTLSGVSLSTQVTGTLPLANGGTGATLSDPNADRLLFWDDSAGTMTWLTAGSGLTISGTTISASTSGGTVTSVDVSGGTTGLTTSGGPVTSSGTITIAGTLAIANGGTGATDAATARSNLSAAVSGTNNDITSMTGVTGGISSPDFIQFDTTATVTDATGRLYYEDADMYQTLAFQMNGNVIQHVGEEMFYRVKLSANATKGQVLMFTGTLGASGGLQAAPATGLTADQSNYILGIAGESGVTNDWITVYEFGEVKGIDTTGGAESWVQGDVLYYNPAVTGGLTKNKPNTPNAIAVIAAVIYAHASAGILFVRPTFGSVLGGTDGNVQFFSLTNGDVIVYDGTDQRWENVAQSSLSVGSATNAVNIGITDDTSTNAAMYPVWVTSNSGNLPAKVTSTKLSFNPSTGVLTVAGGLSGGTF